MKIAILPFLVISYAMLTLGVNNHAQAQQTTAESAKNRENHQNEGKLSDGRQPIGSLAERNHASSTAAATAVRPKQLPNNREHSVAKTIANPHSTESQNAAGVTKSGAMPAGTTKRTHRSAPATSVVRSSVPPRNDGRHSGANPAVIGGTLNSPARNTAAINGTSVHRRP
jgi:hypothetical protein